MFLNDRFQATDQRVECVVGIIFLGPKGITDLCLGQQMGVVVEEHLHQLLLHRSQSDLLSLCIIESAIALRISQTSECHEGYFSLISPETIEAP